jgi:hypothetical protein
MRQLRIAAALSAAAAAATLLLTTGTPSVHAAADRVDAVRSDFDGNGYSDLAIGVPFEDQAGSNDGAVNVIYATPSGLNATADQVWTQDSPGIGGGSEANDAFGYALATGDFDADGYADLAVGVPFEDQSASNDGAVNVIYGSAAGLTSAGNQVWSQDSPGIGEVREAGDQFGSSLAAGDFDGDGYSDLAIGVPEEDLTSQAEGAVNVIYGSPAGLAAAGSQVWSQNSVNVEGTSEVGDRFGSSLAAANFGGTAQMDLAIGVPDEDVSATNDGAVNVLYGSVSGLTATGDQLWSQDSAGIGGVAEAGDEFGRSLAAGDLGVDTYADLAIGVPNEDQVASDDGAVNVLYGSAVGLVANGNQVWSQNSAGIAGASEASDHFGVSVVIGDFDGDHYLDLAIGVPYEDQAATNDGAVNVIYGTAGGLASAGNQVWSQGSAGVGGSPEANDRFGIALTVGSFGHNYYADLVVGVPAEDQAATDDGAVNVVYGSAAGLASTFNQVWSQDSAGIDGVNEANDDFGFAVAAS